MLDPMTAKELSSTQTNFGIKWLVFICFFKIMFFSLESIMFIYCFIVVTPIKSPFGFHSIIDAFSSN